MSRDGTLPPGVEHGDIPGNEGPRSVWVVEQTKTYKRRDGSDMTVTSYWHGPNHGWGNTWSGHVDDWAVATFDSKEEAEAAYQSTLGELRRGVVILEIET